ncbi:MAG: hypothetical protein ACXW4H_05390 [Candidatus Limnocylindrales bacterium]
MLGTAERPRRGTGVEARPTNAADGPSPRPADPLPLARANLLRPAEQDAPAGPDPAAIPESTTTTPPGAPEARMNGSEQRPGQCTAPQLRRFIKSRPYVPMHELRRRFSINGEDDDVTPVRLDPGWIYVGLPSREGLLLGDLLRTGEIGYELSLDPRTPIVVGVYPMRPIARN